MTSLLSFHTRIDVFIPAWWAHSAWACGKADMAADLAADALERARAANHIPSQVVAKAYGAITAQLLGDREGCERLAGEGCW